MDTQHLPKSITGPSSLLGTNRHKAVLAADSRAYFFLPNGKIKVDDGYCKLATASGKFLIAGYGSDGNADFSLTLQGKKLAEQVLASSREATQATLDDIANQWRGLVTSWIHGIGPEGVEHLRKIKEGSEGSDRVLGAVFVLRTVSGDLLDRHEGIDIGADSEPVPLSPPLESPEGELKFSVFGRADVFAQFFMPERPDFIRNELALWNTERNRSDYDEFRVRRLVELTIQHTAKKDTVGGHVNSVEIDAHGIHWITDNPECRNR